MRLRIPLAALILPPVMLALAGCGADAPESAAPAQTQPASSAQPERIVTADLMRVVTELADPRYAGRQAGTDGGRLARAYVRTAFAQIGLAHRGTSGYEQPFTFGTVTDAVNLIGEIKGTRPAATRAIVLTAHYDHLGVREGQTYPGADDNASGVAALLAIARYVKAHPLQHTVIVAALDAEEGGLNGAKAFVARPPAPLTDMAIDINFDMVSRNDKNEIYVAGTSHYPWLTPLLENVGRQAKVKLLFGHDRPAGSGGPEDWTLQSDHGEFHKAGVPFVYFGVEDHPDYHKPTDTADKIDPVFFRNVVEMLLDAVIAIDSQIDGLRP